MFLLLHPRIWSISSPLILFSCRTCPGRYIAEKTLFLSIATTLTVFDIMAVSGHMPKYEFDDGFIRYVSPKYVIVAGPPENESVQSAQTLQVQYCASFIRNEISYSGFTPWQLTLFDSFVLDLIWCYVCHHSPVPWLWVFLILIGSLVSGPGQPLRICTCFDRVPVINASWAEFISLLYHLVISTCEEPNRLGN